MNNTAKLTDAQRCIETIFPDVDGRPCHRTFQNWKARRVIPCVKIGRRVFFDPDKVRAALDKKFTIESR